ncbi:hypothetical protein [Rheinheimera oceanensis]|uniref:hypothetical protein n=1 Tax=Rheinheimera oceanensis TaxID=2817449 RepID=UPI001BFED212|nr:hypothetical protein [Rheinheimera oceanensis]
MRWLSSFALLLYLSLLCTPQAFAVHDQRLSPLADTQFHALTPSTSHHTVTTEQDSTDEPQPVLPVSAGTTALAFFSTVYAVRSVFNKAPFLVSLQARAPPVLPSH